MRRRENPSEGWTLDKILNPQHQSVSGENLNEICAYIRAGVSLAREKGDNTFMVEPALIKQSVVGATDREIGIALVLLKELFTVTECSSDSEKECYRIHWGLSAHFENLFIYLVYTIAAVATVHWFNVIFFY